jgi:hypothetical protein
MESLLDKLMAILLSLLDKLGEILRRRLDDLIWLMMVFVGAYIANRWLTPIRRLKDWYHFSLLKSHYEGALRRAAQEAGKPKLADIAIQILWEGFFDKFVKPKGISPEEEFNEFLRLLRERLPQVEGLEEFLENAYNELATSLEGDKMWGDRGKDIAEFLWRREEPKEALREEQPIVPVTSHFTLIPNHKNFLDRQSELEQLRAWLKDEKATVGVLVGIGGQGKTYLAAKFAEECQQNGWQVRWAEFKGKSNL